MRAIGLSGTGIVESRGSRKLRITISHSFRDVFDSHILVKEDTLESFKLGVMLGMLKLGRTRTVGLYGHVTRQENVREP